MVSKAHCALSIQPGELLVICRPSANLLTLDMQPLNTSCKAQHALRQPHPGEYSGCGERKYRRGGGGGWLR